ncbi:MAG: hypothetical protein V7459_16105 [Oceanicoccus sp.]
MNKILYVLALVLLLPLVGCEQDSTASATDISADYQTVTDIRQTMLWILEPAADVLWDSAGTIITEEGDRELAPTTDEGWQHVINNAAVVAETGNLLMMPDRAAGADWVEYAGGLTAAAKMAIKAAQDQDSDALFDAGGRIYQVCKACHSQYLIESESSD